MQATTTKVGMFLDRDEKEDALAGIAEKIALCKRCLLHENRIKTVPGDGNPDAKVVICAEAPGATEDREGKPFVGRAGQLLNKILEKSGLSREEVFILNICKCRPPSNRDPEAEEMRTCKKFLDKQLDIICPETIVTMGRCASQMLFETMAPIGAIRGEVKEINGFKMLATYHPAYLLRNQPALQTVLDDFAKIGAE